MASSDVDQRFLGRFAKATAADNSLLSSSLYQILGLSVLLARKVYRARKQRKLDRSRDTKSLSLYHHIIWLSREGLSILEVCVLPYTQDGQHGPECQVLIVRLRASFYHIFCLFHNQPPVSQLSVPTHAPPTTAAPLSPRSNDGRPRRPANSPTSRSRDAKAAATTTTTAQEPRSARTATLRDPIPSITSEASYLTNPYATVNPISSPLPGLPPGLQPVSIPHPSAFLLPPLNFLPLATAHFNTASALAASLLPGSHPLRLSVALEHAAFLWDCMHDHGGARRLARQAIREVYRAPEGMDDAEFQDAAELVAALGRTMRRKSWEGTPRVGGPGAGSGSDAGFFGAEVAEGSATAAASVGSGLGSPTLVPSTMGSATGGLPTVKDPSGGTTATAGTARGESGGPATGSPPGSAGRRSAKDSGGSQQRSSAGSGSGASKETTPRTGTNRGSGESGSSTPRAAQQSGAARSPSTFSSNNPYRVERRR